MDLQGAMNEVGDELRALNAKRRAGEGDEAPDSVPPR